MLLVRMQATNWRHNLSSHTMADMPAGAVFSIQITYFAMYLLMR